jgi:hypothetical protein
MKTAPSASAFRPSVCAFQRRAWMDRSDDPAMERFHEHS